MSRYPDGIGEGDVVELTHGSVTLLDPGRSQRELPAGTQGVVERRTADLLRLWILEPSPADGMRDAAVVGASRVRRVGTTT